MPPKGTSSRTANSSNSRTANTPIKTPDKALSNQQATIENQQAKIERLRQLLEQARSRPVRLLDTPGQLAMNQGIKTLVKTLVRTLDRSNTPGSNRTTKSAKIPDPPLLTDSKDPTFES